MASAQPVFDSTASAERRTDLDWLRIAAFGLLILFHVGMFYAPMEWVVKSPRLLPWMEIALGWSAPWRLLLLFIVSGAATRFMLRRQSPPDLFGARSRRLLPPLAFTALIVVPPQVYFTVVERLGYGGGFWHFWLRYLGFGPRFCLPDHCLVLPTWSHLWFVAYLWIYTTLLVGLLAFVPVDLEGIARAAMRRLVGWRLLVVPAGALALVRICLAHFFPETHGLIDDWYLHVVFLGGFLFGFLLITDNGVMKGFGALRWMALAVAIASYVLRAMYTWNYHDQPIPLGLKLAMAVVYGFDQWGCIVAALGFARRHLSARDGPARRYLTQAIFPYYIVHQTAIVVVAHELARLRLPLGLEAALVIAATAASCGLAFEVARRVGWLRPWLGLARRPVREKLARPMEASLKLPP